jgi:replicative DNA helicase
MQQEKNFGFLGFSFQQSLIRSIIEDKKFGETIIDFIDSKYFDNNSFRYIVENIKELYTTYNKLPDYQTLSQKIMTESGTKDTNRVHLDTLQNIKDDDNDTLFVKDTALNFCKQQNLKKELKNVHNIIESGEFESYNKIEEIIKRALQVGLNNDEAVDVFHNIDEALEDNFRLPIPTGIVGIDQLLKGGLGRGELGVVLAPTGTGKTTLLTKFANTAYNQGFNVVQIFFEDNPGNIKRKHYTIWSGITPDDQPSNSDEVKRMVKEAEERSSGSLKLMKFPSDSVTVSQIKNIVRKMKSDGFKLDLLLIDYVDCISTDKSTNGEEWKGEGSVMRSLESMTSEFDIALWTATQGNRDSISSEVVTGDQMGGSIKKAQIAHVIMSIGKTLEQKDQNLATLSLLKSRIGKDGVVFSNCKFNNEYLVIDTESQNTLLGMEQQKTQNNANRAAEAFKKRQELLNNK